MTTKASEGRTQAQRSQESSRRLMAAAIELIAEKGFDRTTATEIGERAGYSRNMVRARYGSKEALLESLLETAFEPLFLSALPEGADGLHTVLDRVELLAQQAEDKPANTQALFTLVFETVGPLKSLGPWLRTWLAGYHTTAAGAFRQGQADGSIRSDLDPELEAVRILNYGLGLAFRWALDPTGVDFARELRLWIADMRVRFSPS